MNPKWSPGYYGQRKIRGKTPKLNTLTRTTENTNKRQIGVYLQTCGKKKATKQKSTWNESAMFSPLFTQHRMGIEHHSPKTK